MPDTTAASPHLSLLWITLAAVVGLVLLVSRWKLHAFLGLLVASIFVGVAAGVPPRTILTAFETGMGTTLGFVGLVVGLGAMLGKLLAESGGAEVVAQRLIAWMGPARLPSAMMLVALVVGLPVFFGVGVVLLMPVLRTLVRQTGGSRLLLGLPMMAGLSVAHGLVPPHPGPLVAIEKLHADIGKTILWSLVIGLPTAAVAGPLFARWITPRVPALTPMATVTGTAPSAERRPPSFVLTLFTILLPVLLMFASTLTQVAWPAGRGGVVRDWVLFAGSPVTAMLLAVLFAWWAFGRRCGFSPAQLLRFSEECLGPIAVIFLVVGAGGGFSKVLVASGVDQVVAHTVQSTSVSPLLLGWILAALIRVAVGSATVAITLAAGLAAPIAAAVPGTNPELLVIALGAGSLALSHLNDGGFWFVKEYLELDVPQTLRTWTVLETLISVVALGLALALDHWF
jgi:GntP family gluconate:H+ symporter